MNKLAFKQIGTFFTDVCVSAKRIFSSYECLPAGYMDMSCTNLFLLRLNLCGEKHLVIIAAVSWSYRILQKTISHEVKDVWWETMS